MTVHPLYSLLPGMFLTRDPCFPFKITVIASRLCPLVSGNKTYTIVMPEQMMTRSSGPLVFKLLLMHFRAGFPLRY